MENHRFPKSRNYRKFLLFHLLPVVAVLLIGAAITRHLYLFAQESQEKIFENYFRVNAREHLSAIEHEIEMVISPLEQIEAFFTSSQNVEKGEFSNFIGPVLKAHEEIVGIFWIERMTPEELERKSQYQIVYIQPESLVTEYSGMDLAANKFYLDLFTNVQDKARPAVHFGSSRQTLHSKVNTIVLRPVYSGTQPPVLVEQRRQMLKGFIIEWIDFTKLIEKVLKVFPAHELNLNVSLIKEKGEEELLYKNYTDTEIDPDTNFPKFKRSGKKIFESRIINLEEEKIYITCFPKKTLFSKTFLTSDMILKMGIFLTLLITWLIHLLLTRTEAVQRLVDLRTQELKVKTEDAIRAYLKLKPEIEERKVNEKKLHQAIDELKSANEELEKFNKLMIGRELKMMELKVKLREAEKK